MDDPSGLSLFGTQQEHATNGAIGGCNGASIDASAALVDCSKERLDIDKLSLLKRKTDESVEGLPAGVRHKCNKRQKKEAATESWSVMYDRLVNFKQMYGDTLVPKRFAQDPKLGTWVETQRVQYRHLSRVIDQQTGKEIAIPSTRLSAERLEKLQAIDFAWTAKNVVCKRVADAMNDGNGRSPSAVTGMTKRPTGSFTGVSCKANDESQWYELFDLLVEYKQTYGHCLVPRKYDACPRLAAWVEQQRRAVATLTKSASASAALNQVSDFSPEKFATPPLAFDSTNHLGAVGDVEIYLGAISSEHDSPKIINDKTSAFTCVDKTLSSEKKAKLDALGFVWSLRSKRVDDHWETMFQQLLDYRQMYGDCLVPSRWKKNPKLGKWIETQRYEHTKLQRSSAEITEGTDGGVTFKASTPRLTEERIRRLESVGFEWRVKQKMKRYYQRQWDVMFDRLLLFKKQTGHTCVPKRYPPDTKLGTWMHTQRIQWNQYRKQVGKVDGASSDSADDLNKRSTDEDMSFRLTDERRRRLEEIGFVWSAREGDSTGDEGRAARNSNDEQWDGMFTRLKAYYDIYGHTMVPKRYKDDPKLGTWVGTQRVLHRQKPGMSRLTEERIRRLNELCFVWSLRDDWNKHFEELVEYKRTYGNTNVPARYAKNRRLGIWVSSLRQKYKILQAAAKDPQKPQQNCPLTQERIDLLNKLGFTWTIRVRKKTVDQGTHHSNDLTPVDYAAMEYPINMLDIEWMSGNLAFSNNGERSDAVRHEHRCST